MSAYPGSRPEAGPQIVNGNVGCDRLPAREADVAVIGVVVAGVLIAAIDVIADPRSYGQLG
jgi:hypothetical protein